MRPSLPPAVSGDWRETRGRAGRLGYYVAGRGAPLLLVHSINAAGSAAEVRPLFEHFRRERRVYAVDLPGFGTADRSARDYTVRLYVDAVHDMLDAIADEAPGVPVDALALSLSCEYLARAATERPERLRTLTLVTPTGFSRGSSRLRGPRDASREVPGLYPFLTFAPWRAGLYALLTRPAVIRYFLERTWGSKDIDEALFAYDVLTARMPGAMHAPYAFLSARLFSRDVRSVYEQLTHRVWLAHGTRGDFRDFSEAAWTAGRANWTVQAWDSGALPFFEQPEAFCAAYGRFLAQPAGPARNPATR